jgi:hypothetical protein
LLLDKQHALHTATPTAWNVDTAAPNHTKLWLQTMPERLAQSRAANMQYSAKSLVIAEQQQQRS